MGVTVGRIAEMEIDVADQGGKESGRVEAAEVGVTDRRDLGNAGPTAETDAFELHRQTFVKPDRERVATGGKAGREDKKMDRLVRGGAEIDGKTGLLGEKMESGGIARRRKRRRSRRLGGRIAQGDQATGGMEIAGSVGEGTRAFETEEVRIGVAIVEPNADELALGSGKLEAVGGGPKEKGRGNLLQKGEAVGGLNRRFSVEQKEEAAGERFETGGENFGQGREIGIGPRGGKAIESGEHPNESGVEMVAIETDAESEQLFALEGQAVFHRPEDGVATVLGGSAESGFPTRRPKIFGGRAWRDGNKVCAGEFDRTARRGDDDGFAANRRLAFETSAAPKNQEVAARARNRKDSEQKKYRDD